MHISFFSDIYTTYIVFKQELLFNNLKIIIVMERITKKCYLNILNHISKIKIKDLPDIRKRIQEARKNGDYSENAELQYELKQKKETEQYLAKMEKIINNSIVIDMLDIDDIEIVQFGASVSLLSSENVAVTYHIVGLFESDINKKYIYYKSPLAKQMMGKSIGDKVTILEEEYTITHISYDNITV